MKFTSLLSAAFISAVSIEASAQGSLTPPAGPPAPVFKTLDQVEARIPLTQGQPGVSINAAGTITISQPGSYYLTGNRTITTAGAHGIHVTSGNVTLDLNGYTLTCTSVNGGSAVHINFVPSVTVENGRIAGGSTATPSSITPAGWQHGVFTVQGSSSQPGYLVRNLGVTGVREFGIILTGNAGRVEHCSVDISGSFGIYANLISHCTALRSASYAISTTSDGGVVTNCIARTINSPDLTGINATGGTVSHSQAFGTSIGISASVVSDCHAQGGSFAGISATTVSNSYAFSGPATGIAAETVTNSQGQSTSGKGLTAVTAMNSSGTVVSGAYGMEVSGTASFCSGRNSSGSIAIKAAIAIGCTATSGTISAPQKHLGTP